ncbi:MAG: biotin transporter BioY [Candidatus Omnitrophica bacterium]|nr:biotin transporter BioY [Candidatus Omnitrophota bacterium]
MLAGALIKKEVIASRSAVALIGVTCFVLCTALGAYVYIPLGFTPVPLTLQTFFVLLSGAILGRRLGSLSQGAYLILGAAGIPLLSAGSFGLARIAGPTGGYLIGFVLAAYIVGKIVSGKGSLLSIITALICGELIILLSGAGWLYAGFHFSLRQALYMGILPFIPGDIIKIVVATLIIRKYLARSKELFS